ncbi:MAG: DUF1549 domain-containing protein, partial [Planctomycetaceae bacterium]|nr:DUF1549 domain-containing protein [Planctomycetaceae bacterium]
MSAVFFATKIILAGTPLVAVLSGTSPAQDSSYLTEVRPILANRCFACHGPDAEQRKGDLRLDMDSPADSESAAIVPGKPDESSLMERILTSDPELVMPPADAGPRLTDREVEILRHWIANGARREVHWAFVPPSRPSPPVLPADVNPWCRSPIDHFIAEALLEKDLRPASQADPWSLVRRVSLDLTGLPPTPQQADAFASDPSDEAYARLVDELLQSPRFGEHWARKWLDLARYADTKGYEKDQPRNIWRYRDWVINAINSDMPYDQFTREQLAGDLLPEATTEQILATAFHRNTMTNDEGGTDNEEFRVLAVKDRVDTTVQVWMGLTMGCAKCHTHKYDPITNVDYYRFYAYFNQTEDADRPDDAPRLSTPTSEQEQQLAKLNNQIAEARRNLNRTTPELTDAQRVWERELARSRQWFPVKPVAAVSTNGTALTVQSDFSLLASGEMPGTDVYQVDLQISEQQPVTAIRLEMLTDDSLPRKGPGRNASDPNFVLSELTASVIDESGQSLPVKLAGARASFSQQGWNVEQAIDGNSETGWAISPKQGEPHVAVFPLHEPQPFSGQSRLRMELSQQYPANSLLIGRMRISVSHHPSDNLQAVLQSFDELAAVPIDQRSNEQQKRLDDEFRRTSPLTAAAFAKLSKLQEELKVLRAAIPETPVMRDLSAERARETHVHVRGNFLEQGEAVSAALPESLATDASPLERFGDRRDVVDWLIHPRNPLTARVAVNRVWSQFFGRGIVET